MARRRRGGWSPPRMGSKARRDMPPSAFFLPSRRMFPYKRKSRKTGRWVVDPRGVRAAASRAGQHGYPGVLRRARALRKRMQAAGTWR